MTTPTREEVQAMAALKPTLAEAEAQLQEAELAGYKIPAEYGPWTAYRIILACQSMSRQPATDEDERAALRVLGDHLSTAFAGNTVLAESIAAGWR